ncbi:hypothetical protein [Streptomyces sp. NPDC089799]|uniref:hypothetical protein n=1 Tax=Streptomyces sp. NPDC089799 TaxID=3155066 RepID=UPI00342F8C76
MSDAQTWRVPVTHNMYVITDTDADEPDDSRPGNGLVRVNDDHTQATILTGTTWGHLDATVDIRTGPPTAEEEDWDDIVEASLHFEGDGPLLGSLITEDLQPLDLTPAGHPDQWWRFRFHARGRDEAAAAGDQPTQDDGTPIEQHLIQIWPGPKTTERQIKTTDATGADYRAP